MTFCKSTFFTLFLLVVNGVFGDEVKSVSVMEGDSVTLNTDLTHIQTDDYILWQFGPQETVIAEIHTLRTEMFRINEIFGDRLMLDNQNGSLTITNIRITNSGLYKLLIRSDGKTSRKRFNVTVYARLPVPVITRDCSSSTSERSSSLNCSLLCSVMNVSHVTLSWYKGNSLLSNISVSDLNIRLSLSLVVEYQDTNTYSCVINNPITNHTTHLNITDVCQPCSDPPSVNKYLAGIIPAVLAVLAVVVIYFLYKKHKRDEQKRTAVETEEEVHYADTTNKDFTNYQMNIS